MPLRVWVSFARIVNREIIINGVILCFSLQKLYQTDGPWDMSYEFRPKISFCNLKVDMAFVRQVNKGWRGSGIFAYECRFTYCILTHQSARICVGFYWHPWVNAPCLHPHGLSYSRLWNFNRSKWQKFSLVLPLVVAKTLQHIGHNGFMYWG